ncbi:zinc-binding dehydrogenase [Epidermidibacterium keratini]|uniref:Zinc-binding dehydrogenase n=1 Tax=Epidermidibacterium keratini TaxID=1891644 RepID=A0A7L4YN07_9ACTN|nr:zinc-binding dehydrogenase [Epidermidibacterium keratini]QHC00526.1 zinc-binding dehydrogenase [Epidermidibacterium keratini]
MRAVQVKKFGGPEVLEVVDLPAPQPGQGEVLIDVEAADVMFLDTRLRSGWGLDFFPLELPYIPGGAVGGVVAAVGDDAEAGWLGKRVVSRTAASGIGGGLPTGGYAEQALAKTSTLMEVAANVPTAHSVAMVADGRTALAVFDRAAVQPESWVLITAAAGGLGTLLTQLAVSAGAKVVAAARGEQKLSLAQRLGADTVIDYGADGWEKQVREITGGGADVVFDGAGGALGGEALNAGADGGIFLGYGAAAGDFAAIDADAAAARDITVLSLSDITAQTADWEAVGHRAQAELADGRLRAVIGQTFPLEQAVQAHAAIEDRSALGRTILQMR